MYKIARKTFSGILAALASYGVFLEFTIGTLVIPDVHLPWGHDKAIKKMHKWYKKHKPDLVICLGDLTDQKIWSRWQQDVDDFSPSQEFEMAYKDIKKLQKLFPEMLIIRGNHDTRVLSKAIEGGIPSQMFKDVDEVFACKGWKWYKRSERLIVQTASGPILFQHGIPFFIAYQEDEK